MKKFHLLFPLLLALLLANCSKKQHYTVTGSLGKLDSPATVYLLEVRDRAYVVRDSAILNNGKFTFKGAIDTVIGVQLALNREGTGHELGTEYKGFFLEQGDIIVADGNGNLREAVISGTPNNDAKIRLYEEVTSPLNHLRAKLTKKQEQVTSERGESEAFKAELGTTEEQIMEYGKSLVSDFIFKYPNVMVSLYELGHLADVEDYDKVALLYNSLSDEIKQHPIGQEFAIRLEKLKKFTVGSVMPEFALPDTSGRPVSSSDFNGQYLLVDLWAAWCTPCRAENPNLVALYNKYHDKNFNILGVSLDDSQENWLAAIQKDGLTWTQVSDLKLWQSKAVEHFGISSIPTNYLIDPSGKIIARDLHGQALRTKLKELLEEGT